MDGDFAPMSELAKLRKSHGFLLVIDDVSSMNVHLPPKRKKRFTKYLCHGTV